MRSPVNQSKISITELINNPSSLSGAQNGFFDPSKEDK
jgi:hypothetical protein